MDGAKPQSSSAFLPDFIVIGALKAGTNSIYEYLRGHPQIFMSPVKEPSFFAYTGQQDREDTWLGRNAITQWDEYVALFQGASGYKAIGEVSPMYLITPQAPERIHHYLPRVRLIAILRQPADRTYSQWQMEVRNGTETIRDFSAAFLASSQGLTRQHYLHDGRYYALLKPYYDLFGASRILVLISEQFQLDPLATLGKIYQFLDVDPDYHPDITRRYNEGGVWRSRNWEWFMKNIYEPLSLTKQYFPPGLRDRLVASSKRLTGQALVKAPQMDPLLRAQLTAQFKDDILLLQDLIGQDLSFWLD